MLGGGGDCKGRRDGGQVLFPHQARTGVLHLLVQPGTWLVCGRQEKAPVFPEVWRRIAPLIEGLPLVAHNKAFDESCLKAVFRVYQMDYPEYEFHCTCLAARRRWPGGRHTLDLIAARCGYDLKNHHHALADAEACAAIALRLL